MAGEFKDVRVFWATTSAVQFALALVLFVENLDQIGNEDGLESLHANETRKKTETVLQFLAIVLSTFFGAYGMFALDRGWLDLAFEVELMVISTTVPLQKSTATLVYLSALNCTIAMVQAVLMLYTSEKVQDVDTSSDKRTLGLPDLPDQTIESLSKWNMVLSSVSVVVGIALIIIGFLFDSPLERSLTFIGILSLASGCLGFSALKWRKRFLFAISFGLSMGVVVASWNVSVLVVFRSGADTQTGADNSGERNGTTAILDGSGSIENDEIVLETLTSVLSYIIMISSIATLWVQRRLSEKLQEQGTSKIGSHELNITRVFSVLGCLYLMAMAIWVMSNVQDPELDAFTVQTEVGSQTFAIVVSLLVFNGVFAPSRSVLMLTQVMLAFTATSSWYNFIEHSLRPQEFGRRTPTTDNFAVANISTFVVASIMFGVVDTISEALQQHSGHGKMEIKKTDAQREKEENIKIRQVQIEVMKEAEAEEKEVAAARSKSKSEVVSTSAGYSYSSV